HAPEVECIGRGKARAPYEFGCKVSIATPVTAPKGGQFVLHAKALHGNPYDGHTLGPIVADLEKLTGVTVRRIHGEKGYRGHNYPNRFKVWISGQVRRVTKAIRREMRRRAAIEPVIGHLKEDHRMGRNYLTGRDGDRINAVLAAAGYNFSLLLRWFEELLRVLSLILCHALLAAPLHLTRCRKTFFTADQGGSPHVSHLSHPPRWASHQLRARRCQLDVPPAPALVRGAFTRPLVDPLPRPLGRPASPNQVPQNFLHGRLTRRAGLFFCVASRPGGVDLIHGNSGAFGRHRRAPRTTAPSSKMRIL